MSRCTIRSSSSPSSRSISWSRSASPVDSPRSTLSISGVSWPESISAWRMACRSASSDRSPSPPSSCQNDGRPARESRLQQEVAELVEQALQIDRVGELGVVLGVGGEAHDVEIMRERVSGDVSQTCQPVILSAAKEPCRSWPLRFAQRDTLSLTRFVSTINLPPCSRSSVFSALRHRDFRLFLGGQLVSQCGTWVQTVAQGWLVLQLTDSAFAVGLVTALGSLPILLFTLYGGVVADRVDKRRLVLAAPEPHAARGAGARGADAPRAGSRCTW